MDELVLLIDRWLKHPSYGLVAMLATVPRKTPENTEFDAPANPAIYNDQETLDIINGDQPPSSPAVVVFHYADVALPETNRNVQISNSAIVAIGYVTIGEDVVKARRESGYVLRAIRKSLNTYNNQSKSEGYRELNGIKIAQVRHQRIQRSGRGVGSSMVWGFVLATLDVMDKAP